MKKLIALAVFALVLTSCGNEKKETKKKIHAVSTEVKKTTEEAKKTEEVKEVAEVKSEAAKGKELFTSKGCVACHQVDTKVVGPALKNIAKTYADKKGNIFDFLRGKSNAIVDTDPAQVAIMKANITGMLKDMKDDEIKAVVDYITSTAK